MAFLEHAFHGCYLFKYVGRKWLRQVSKKDIGLAFYAMG
jgi:hypothetical protein